MVDGEIRRELIESARAPAHFYNLIWIDVPIKATNKEISILLSLNGINRWNV